MERSPIVATILPDAERRVVELFAASDPTQPLSPAHVRHRSPGRRDNPDAYPSKTAARCGAAPATGRPR
jgi:hypothetical protein